jgi:hypothetical protein
MRNRELGLAEMWLVEKSSLRRLSNDRKSKESIAADLKLGHFRDSSNRIRRDEDNTSTSFDDSNG